MLSPASHQIAGDFLLANKKDEFLRHSYHYLVDVPKLAILCVTRGVPLVADFLLEECHWPVTAIGRSENVAN